MEHMNLPQGKRNNVAKRRERVTKVRGEGWKRKMQEGDGDKQNRKNSEADQ